MSAKLKGGAYLEGLHIDCLVVGKMSDRAVWHDFVDQKVGISSKSMLAIFFREKRQWL